MPARIAGTILAGGRSRRMGGRDKALLPLAGRPLLRHVIERVSPQVAELGLSVDQPSATYDDFGLPQLPDPVPGHHGPLGGLLAALRHFGARHEWVLMVPCDAPFLPPDLAAQLHRSAEAAAAPGALVLYDGEPQPTFSLWHRRLLPDLERAVVTLGQGGFKQFARTIEVAECAWALPGRALDPSPFFNINDPAALQEAGRWARPAPEECSECSA
jgi:molybdopterin-guanine dinucleotide biosynthesis protein A